MDFFLTPQPIISCPVRYYDLAHEVEAYDGRILSHVQAGKLCRKLQEMANKAVDELNARRHATYGRPTEWHPDLERPKVELRPRDNHLALVVEGYILAVLHLVNGYGLLTEDGSKTKSDATN